MRLFLSGARRGQLSSYSHHFSQKYVRLVTKPDDFSNVTKETFVRE